MPTSEDMIADAPPMKVRNAAAWEDALRVHGPEVVGFAERFARLSQAAFADDKRIGDVGEEIMAQANTGGLDGLMIDIAVRLLIVHWLYDERLRQWYNATIKPGPKGDRTSMTVAPRRVHIDF